jgi:hypothetical protein
MDCHEFKDWPHMTTRRRLYPMPIAGLIDHPEFIAMSAAGRGMLVTLVLYYWQSECQPIPTKRSELFVVCRGNPQMWHKYYDKILRIFSDIKKELDDYYEARESKKTTFNILSARARANARAKRLGENAPVLADVEDRAPQREKARYERIQTPEERGARPRAVPTRKG